MAKNIVWDSLTQTEAQTLADLKAKGAEIFAAPIEIEHPGQLETLGISWDQCRTWHIGPEKVTVRLTPADEETYKFLLGELRAKHRDAYRENRCKVPGKRPKTLIRCPENYRCADCPYPEYRDRCKPNTLSWDAMVDSGYEGEDGTHMEEKVQAKMEYEDIEKEMDKKNPCFSKALKLKVLGGYTVKEIAMELGTSERNVYYYIDMAKTIGKKAA